VSGERIMKPQLSPHLWEARVDVKEDAPRCALQNVVLTDEAHHIQEQR
jgi:hypothetical protein